MSSHMGVQRLATERNEQAEIIIDFILQLFINKIHIEGHIVNVVLPTRQKLFSRDDCRDIFDHFVEIELIQSPMANMERIQLWAQTTCYKGNKLGRAESNKTYEIRETLVEALGLRRWLKEEGFSFRTIHFTIGPVNYTYGWFKSAKDSAFDLSLYPDPIIDTEILFNELSNLFRGATLEYEFYDLLESVLNQTDSQITTYINTTLNQLYDWFLSGMPEADMANKQANLLTILRQTQQAATNQALQSSLNGGMNIKGQIQELLQGAETHDPVLVRTLKRLHLGNPFLPTALEAELNWPEWSKTHFAIPSNCTELYSYIHYLWTSEGSERLIYRRLLLRIHTDESISYIQDTNIPGLTEHNLYNGVHSGSQVQSIVTKIVTSCKASGIQDPTELYTQLVSQRGLQLLRSSRRFESVNGTNLKPSFFYVEEKLSEDYLFLPFNETPLPLPIAYHASFSSAKASTYENLKVIVSKKTSQPIAIIKAKFFRRQEFSRRAKEEAYVGFTTKFALLDGEFLERYPNIPLIMFVDMTAISPPDYAIRRLTTAGWEIFFSTDELQNFLLRCMDNKNE